MTMKWFKLFYASENLVLLIDNAMFFEQHSSLS